MAPKNMKLTGNKNHCKTIHSHLNLPNLGGLGGNKIIEMIAEEISPNMAMSMTVLVMKGKLNERIVRLKAAPPTITGNQPKRKIMIAFVAAE